MRVYATSLGLTLGQEGSAGKGNELKAILALLDMLVHDGSIVTLDAIGCQTDMAAAIVEKGGDNVLAVKAKQKTLSEALSESFEIGEVLGWGKVDMQRQATVENGSRTHRDAASRPGATNCWLPEAIRTAWPTLGAVVMIETAQEKGNDEGATISTDRRYFILGRGVTTVGDFPPGGPGALGIESMHWVLDVTFREDAGRVRKERAARNLSLLRKNHPRHAPPRYRLFKEQPPPAPQPRFPKTSLQGRTPRPSPSLSVKYIKIKKMMNV